MAATIGGTYNFIGSTTWISTLDTQVHDSTTTLVITGISSDVAFPVDRIQLTITKYKGVTGTFGIVLGESSAYYYHNGIYYTALGGIVSITHVYSDHLVGYFNFINSNSTLNVTNGAFTVLKP